MSNKIKIVWIVVSLAALAIILFPIFSFPSSQNRSGPGSVLSEEPIDEISIAPPEISDEDFKACNSINEDVEAIIAGVDESPMNATKKIGSDLLLGEYCNRPALVHEINATGNPALSLVAYACDAGSGKIGDSQLKDSLVDHREIYCASASVSIQEEAEILRAAALGFREDFILALKDDNSTATNAEFAAELEASVDEILAAVDGAQSSITSDEHYSAAKMLDSASNEFEFLLERVEEKN
jgi:hypothetical protein